MKLQIIWANLPRLPSAWAAGPHWATPGTTARDGAINASWKTVAGGEWRRVQTAQHLVTGNQEGLIARAQDASHNEWLLNAISINRLRVYQVCGRVVAAATVLIGL